MTAGLDMKRARDARYRAAHRAELNQKAKAYYSANCERVKARTREWYWRNPQERRRVARAYARLDPAAAVRRSREWRRDNPERYSLWNRSNKALRRGGRVRATPEAIMARIEFYGGCCWMCGAPWSEIDHVIPISRGGSNHPANLRPACGPCNRSKGARRVA